MAEFTELDNLTFAAAVGAAIKYHQEHSGGSAVLVGLVSAGGSFPTTRPDGTALQLGDFVKPTGTLPFTIGTITFTNANDQAVYAGSSNWLLNANPFQSTAETPTKVAAEESISGTALTQAEVNKETVKATKQHEFPFTTASTSWLVEHNLGRYPRVTCFDSTGRVMIAAVTYNNSNTLTVHFANAQTGKAVLN